MFNPNDTSLNIVCGELESIIYLNSHASPPPERIVFNDPYYKVIKETRSKPVTYLLSPDRFYPKENSKEDLMTTED